MRTRALAARVSKELEIPVIGIGAGPECDGQVLVWQDMLGLCDTVAPKFVKRFGEVGEAMRAPSRSTRKKSRAEPFRRRNTATAWRTRPSCWKNSTSLSPGHMCVTSSTFRRCALSRRRKFNRRGKRTGIRLCRTLREECRGVLQQAGQAFRPASEVDGHKGFLRHLKRGNKAERSGGLVAEARVIAACPTRITNSQPRERAISCPRRIRAPPMPLPGAKAARPAGRGPEPSSPRPSAW